jgi:hypothetical protein
MTLEIPGAYLGLHSPFATSAPANAYWSADAAFRYGDETILETTSGVFDTGTTLLGLATGKLLRDS